MLLQSALDGEQLLPTSLVFDVLWTLSEANHDFANLSSAPEAARWKAD
jgi:hypothetical protein